VEKKTLINTLNSFKNNTSISELDIELLFCHCLDINKTFLHTNPQKELSETQYSKINDLIQRRLQGEPTWQIIGKAPFWNLEFHVTKDVLTPRKETEFLIEEIIEMYKSNQTGKLSALELGSGSGNISLTLAKEFPAFDFISFDKSKKALKIAKKNQKELNVNNVNFIHSSDFSFIKKRKFDFFFSNPPYIKQDEINALQKEITSFEPRLALDGGEDGLDFYKFIAKNIRTYLTPYASIFLEIGHTQRKEVEKIFKNEAFSLLKCKKDYSNLDRILIFN